VIVTSSTNFYFLIIIRTGGKKHLSAPTSLCFRTHKAPSLPRYTMVEPTEYKNRQWLSQRLSPAMFRVRSVSQRHPYN